VPPDDGNAGPAEDTLDAEADDALTVDATPGAADDGAGDPTPGVIGWSDAGVAAVSTWSRIFDDYLASGTVGNCAQCHAAMMSASNGYAFAKVARMESRFVAMALALARARSNMAFDPP
jgi:cytochrome c553